MRHSWVAAAAALFSSCYATSGFRPDEVPREGVFGESITVVKADGSEERFGSGNVSRRHGALRIEGDLAATEVPLASSTRVEVTTFSPGRTAALVLPTVATVMLLTALAVAASSHDAPTSMPPRNGGSVGNLLGVLLLLSLF
ncbi:MAG: hypothetical protein IPJ65_15980 [Archangiaceae bacterium]|nr:hypothetical protein [Archangiaceae bacterium]